MKKKFSSSIYTICHKISSYYPDAKTELLQRAYEFAKKAHEGQFRSSGEPYIVHPIEVAQILANLHLDIPSIITGLLHDTIEDTHTTLQEIEAEFGKNIAELVDGVTKLSKITSKTSEERQAENFKKMIFAMSKDIRVILVKLSDRLNNMRTLEHLQPQKQKIIAQETLDIYAPIANRLGIGWIKTELEDLCFHFLNPIAYSKLSRKILETKKDREKYFEEISSLLDEKLKEYDMHTHVIGRAKNFYSIFKKMERRKSDYEEIFDIISFHITVDNITECYKALGVIHAAYKPVPGRFKDYIAMPKANAYQSLHTVVIGPSGERIEIQIRTQEMNAVAEAGITASWKYKEGKFLSYSKENSDWINRLLEWNKDLSDPIEFLETIKTDLFTEDAFAFTPQGEVKQLSHGATPLDFAYLIHTDIGHHCISSKVNGKIVPLKQRLKSGDTVEIITSSTQTPKKDWLKIAKSSRAKAKIRSYLREQEKQQAHKLGKEILEKSLLSFNESFSTDFIKEKITDFQKNYNFQNIDELFIATGYGKINTEFFLNSVIPKEMVEKKLNQNLENKKNFLSRVFYLTRKKNKKQNAIILDNHINTLIRFARCCNPLPGDPIIGFITRDHGITVHSTNCLKTLDHEKTLQVPIEWNYSENLDIKRNVQIRVTCFDKIGILSLLSETISNFQINITSASMRTTQDKKVIATFNIQVKDLAELKKIMASIKNKNEVITIERVYL